MKVTNVEICCYCERVIISPLRITVDHLIPLSKGGVNANMNKKISCSVCNLNKNCFYPEQFLLHLIKTKKKLTNKYLNFTEKSVIAEKLYLINVMIKNTTQIINYVQKRGDKLFKNEYDFQEYLDKRNFEGVRLYLSK